MRSLTYCFTVIVALLVSASAMADDIPYRQQRREIFTLLPVNSNSIVFLGDSITDFGLWSEFFGSDPDIINRGIQGIESPEVLEHLSLICAGHIQSPNSAHLRRTRCHIHRHFWRVNNVIRRNVNAKLYDR